MTAMVTKNMTATSFISKLILLICVSVVSFSANAELSEGDSWREKVLLHDGQKMIVQRSQTYGGRSEIGQSPPVKTLTISFVLGGDKRIKWTSEYGEEWGRTNFNLLAIHVLNHTPYLVTTPNLCLSYNKWGRPNPPYIFFKYDGKDWQRISLSDVPIEFKNINLIINTVVSPR